MVIGVAVALVFSIARATARRRRRRLAFTYRRLFDGDKAVIPEILTDLRPGDAIVVEGGLEERRPN